MSKTKPRTARTERELALDDLLAKCPEVFDDALWDLKTKKLTPEQFDRLTEQYIEERIVELRQRPRDESDEHTVYLGAS
jgi:hypothetical protein